MNKICAFIAILALSLPFFGCKTFSAETREYAAVVTELASETAIMNNIVLKWHRDVLEAYKIDKQTEAAAEHKANTGEDLPLDSFIVEIPMTNPEYDPADPNAAPEFIYKDIDEIIKDIDDLMKLNLELAESLDVLNESIQADKGIDPLFKEVKKILEDEEVMALVKLYAEKLRAKTVEE